VRNDDRNTAAKHSQMPTDASNFEQVANVHVSTHRDGRWVAASAYILLVNEGTTRACDLTSL